ncbi:MAG: hypothetical protein WCP15_01505 [bacterium]
MKKYLVILIASLFFSVIIYIPNVSGATQGYTRDSDYVNLSDPGTINLPDSSNNGINNIGNSPSIPPIQADESHQVYHPDINYDNWANQSADLYQKYGGEGKTYNSELKALNQKYFNQDSALPPASYYTTEYGNSNKDTSDTRSIEDQKILKYYNMSDSSVISPKIQNDFLDLINKYEPKGVEYELGLKNYEEYIQPFLDKNNLCNDEELNSRKDCDNSPSKVRPLSKKDEYTNKESPKITQDSPLSSDILAKKLGFKPFLASSDMLLSDIKIYSPETFPVLSSGDVVVVGAPTKVDSVVDGTAKTEVKDTYYIVNKYALPDGYILMSNGEINIGGEQKTETAPDKTFKYILDENNVATYQLMTKEEALAKDTNLNNKNTFKFDFNNTVVADNIVTKVFNSVISTVTGSDAIYGHLTIDMYTKDPHVTLSQFGDFANSLASDNLSQIQTEKSIYDYVNNTIKTQDTSSIPSISLQHNLAQAVALGQGVCRDKAAALEYGLESAGISAAKVVSDNHVFVAVLNPDNTVNHYLDPMYYENYLPLQRSNVDQGQIIYNHYNIKPSDKATPATGGTIQHFLP